MPGLGAFNSLVQAPLSAVLSELCDSRWPELRHSLAFPRKGAIVLALLVAGVLWTAGELPVTSERLVRRKLHAIIPYGALAAVGSLLTVGFAIGLFHVGPSPDRWLVAAALIGCSCISAIAAVRGLGEFARDIFHRKGVLVMGNSYDPPQMGTGLASAQAALLPVGGVLPSGDRAVLRAKGLHGDPTWSIVAADEAAVVNPELRIDRRRDKIPVSGEAECQERGGRRADIGRVRPNTPAATGTIGGSPAAKLARRSADIVLSVLLLICTLPLAMLTAAVIKLDSHGPVFSSQARVGLHGRLFRLLSFRSMPVNGYARAEREQRAVAFSELTRVGRLLRRTRIDELPQLWNVLRGDMSVIGPRPERPLLAARFATELLCYNDRTLVKPGIIGWAQVNCGHSASVEDAQVQLAYDLHYLQYRSVRLDFRILATTVRSVLLGKGSH